MSRLTRKEAAEHLADRRPVIHAGRTLSSARDLESLPDDAPNDFHAKFHADGSLTRPAMEAVIRDGGSVMVNGSVIDSINDLPDAIALAGGNVGRLEQERDRLGDEMKRLEKEHGRVTQEIAKAREAKAAAQKDEAQQGKDEKASGGTAGTSGKKAPGGVNYGDWHIDELREEAAEREIGGRSGMNKAELVKALEKHDRDAASQK